MLRDGLHLGITFIKNVLTQNHNSVMVNYTSNEPYNQGEQSTGGKESNLQKEKAGKNHQTKEVKLRE